MRREHCLVTVLGLVGSACLLSAGCIDYLAEYYTPLTDPNLVADGGSDAGGGGTGGGKPDCAGDPSAKNTLDDCGIFVQADAAGSTEDGSRERPYKTLQKALDNLGDKARVYACGSAPLAEAVTISAGVEVYGGFDCAAGWSWSKDARTQLDGPADSVALTITGEGAKVEGFAITAASPADMKGGGSSIAVAVGDVAATLERCDVTAGDAADGVDGETPSDPVTKGADAPTMGAAGAPTDACVVQAAVSGGTGASTTCDDGMTSGGNGGSGGITGMPDGNGQKGADGQPPDAVQGKGGSGADATNDCTKGTDGKNGGSGASGPGGSSTGDALSLAGITNGDVTDGKPGTKGQGGGGGGGAKSGVFCKVGAMTFDGPGASGGGGGAGGCGGKGGGGGKAGGGSVAIVSLGTKVVLTEVTLAAGKAGKGGKGAGGQGGGAFGLGAVGGAASGQAGSKAGCKGGDGGAGGDGGPGGGGRGGHAIGIAYAKAPATAPTIKTFTGGMAGGGGDPGAAGGNSGVTGSAALCWDLTTHAACAM
jgi:hypothetical protein